MPTHAASGQSLEARTEVAAGEAARQALATLSGHKVLAAIVFASPKHKLGKALATIEGLVEGAPVIGCTTAGELTERGVLRDGIAVLLLAGDGLAIGAHAIGAKTEPDRVATQLSAGYAEAQRQATSRGLPASTTVILVDGLAGTGDRVVSSVLRSTRAFQQIVGGAAGDEGAFSATHVGMGARATSDAAAVLHFFGAQRWGVGVDHGLTAGPERHVVTRSEGNVVREIDGRPAFELYRAHAKARGIVLEPDSAGPYLMANELGLFFLDELRTARAPLSVTAGGGLSCAADVPEGTTICVLEGRPDAMVAAAKHAAEEARAALQGQPAAAVLVFDCVCRASILGDEVGRELDAIKSVFPDAPIAGFFTYGEIARSRGKLDGWHNTTAVIVAIPA